MQFLKEPVNCLDLVVQVLFVRIGVLERILDHQAGEKSQFLIGKAFPPVLVRSLSRLEKEIPSTQQHKDMDESRLPGDLLDVLDDLLLRSVWLRSHGRAIG